MGELLNVLSETDGELTTPLDSQSTPLSTTTFRRTGSLNRRRRKTATLSDHFDRERTLDQLPSPLSPLVEAAKQRPSSMPETAESVDATATKESPSTNYKSIERRRHWTDRRSKSTLDTDVLTRLRREQNEKHEAKLKSEEFEITKQKEEESEPIAPPRRSRSITTPERELIPTYNNTSTTPSTPVKSKPPTPTVPITPTTTPKKQPVTPAKDKGDTPTQRAMFEHSTGNWRNDATSPTPVFDEGKEALDVWRRSRNHASELIEATPKSPTSPPSNASPLTRCNTLPHRWRSDASDSPSRRFTANLSRLGSNSPGGHEADAGVVLAPTHRRQDDNLLAEGVDAFRQREKSALDVGRLSRFQSLALRFRSADGDENELNARRSSKTSSNNNNNNNSGSLSSDSGMDRPSSFCKSDCDSILSGRDEGFESTASQRTSMASNVELGLSSQPVVEFNRSESHLASSLSNTHDDANESASTGYFACSIDSLVQNSNSGNVGNNGGNTTPSDEEEQWTTETYTVEHKVI